MRYCGLKTLPVTISISTVNKQAIAKSIRPLHCNHQVESRPTTNSTISSNVILSDQGLKTLSESNASVYLCEVFPSKLHNQRMEDKNDPICTGRWTKIY